ncbi:MAG: hypothetical protein K5790_01600 [Nitrosopumilus sp.]|uniref:hypothetical protein n=1 Tax=Nitrosopumilus sp. TaxID=2024843 RepID=UPI00247CD735|nr:hypothetical protein [Nitrosopumilus sp.]MCV0391968.1 hypothetical protein [Nitrosopumilus sp.]
MEWYDVFVAILFVIGVTAYPGWNLVLRLELNFENRIKIKSKPSKQSKIKSKPSNQVSELEKIFGV